MAVTAISDIQVPEVYAPYILERTAALSELYQSGIVVRDPAFDALAAQGGTHVDMPFWQDLSGAREILSDSGSLTPAKLATSGDIARIHNDGRAWAWNILAKYASGADPAAALATYIADYWSRVTQTMLINSLTGIFAAPTMSGNLLAIHSESIAGQSAATKLTGSTCVTDGRLSFAMSQFMDAARAMGDWVAVSVLTPGDDPGNPQMGAWQEQGRHEVDFVIEAMSARWLMKADCTVCLQVARGAWR